MSALVKRWMYDIRYSVSFLYICYEEYGANDFLRALNGFASPNFIWTIVPFICLLTCLMYQLM